MSHGTCGPVSDPYRVQRPMNRVSILATTTQTVFGCCVLARAFLSVNARHVNRMSYRTCGRMAVVYDRPTYAQNIVGASAASALTRAGCALWSRKSEMRAPGWRGQTHVPLERAFLQDKLYCGSYYAKRMQGSIVPETVSAIDSGAILQLRCWPIQAKPMFRPCVAYSPG